MKSRCYYSKNDRWEYYGGKGIEICEEWLDFSLFRKWALKNGYAKDLTIDRLNSDDNYKPSNCEWVTRSENSRRMNIAKKLKAISEG